VNMLIQQQFPAAATESAPAPAPAPVAPPPPPPPAESAPRVRVQVQSAPQFWQTNVTGFAAISGVTSKAYFVPHWHWIFMVAWG
jgi:hypothetical protein